MRVGYTIYSLTFSIVIIQPFQIDLSVRNLLKYDVEKCIHHEMNILIVPIEVIFFTIDKSFLNIDTHPTNGGCSLGDLS